MITYDPGYGPLVETRVRIATWNLWARYGPWTERAPAIEATLREVDADIVGLQEVWDDGARNQATELADALGYEGSVFAPNLTFPDGVEAGNAVISRWPIARGKVRSSRVKVRARATTKVRSVWWSSRRSMVRAGRSRSSART